MKSSPKGISNLDHYGRISFLYQAANQMTVSGKYNILSRALLENMDLVSKKTVLRLSPAMKRTVCKKCHNFLIPGIGVSINIQNLTKQKYEHNDVLVYTCTTCGTKKRYPVGRNRKYVLFSERDDVVCDRND